MGEQERARFAATLGAVYIELMRQSAEPLGNWAFPAWMTPPRYRPLQFGMTSRMDPAISASISPSLTAGYERSHKAIRLRRQVYERALREIVPPLKVALIVTVKETFPALADEIQGLSRRFAAPGIEDQLHRSARRIWDRVREPLPGGVREPSTDGGTASAASTASAEEAEGTDAMDVAAVDKVLSGGIADSPEDEKVKEPEDDLFDRVERQALLAAIKEERILLARTKPNGSGESSAGQPTSAAAAESQTASEAEPQTEPKAESDTAQDTAGVATEVADASLETDARVASQVADLLAAIASHPEAVEIIRAYVLSPERGTTSVRTGLAQASTAVRYLADQLSDPETSDDAWAYPPLVVGAVVRLKLADVHGFPEFAVAMGTVLKQTKTKAVLEAATLLLAALTLGIGPAAAGTLALLDLALAGAGAGVALYEKHEKEIAATVTDFSPESKKLTEHPSSFDGALDVAAAMLSAMALIGPARKALALNTKPRDAVVIKKTFSRDVKPLELDFGDHRRGFKHPTKKGGQALYEFYNPNEVTQAEMVERSGRVGDASRTRVGENLELTKEQMRARSKRGLDSPKGQGPIPDQVEDLSDSPSPQGQAPDYQDFNAFDGSKLDVETTPVAPAELRLSPESMRTSQQAMEDASPDLEALFKRERVSTREQVSGLYFRDNDYPRFEELKRKLVASGAPDPVIPDYRFSVNNPPHVDHIVAENVARKLDGFTELDPKDIPKVLHMPKNLEIVSEAVNTSRGDMPYRMWEGTKEFKLPPDIRAAKIAQEQAIAEEMQRLIRSLVDEQRRLKGLDRPRLGASDVGSRLAGEASRGVRLGRTDESGDGGVPVR